MIKIYDKWQDKRLSNGFKVEEFDCNCNSELCHYTLVSNRLLHSLDLLRKELVQSIYLSSSFRCQTYNKEVGGVPQSRHTIGEAADIMIPIKEGYRFAEAARLFFDVVIEYKDEGFIHCHNN